MALLKHLIQGFHSKPGPVPTVDFTGKWKNNLGSEMELEALTNGRVKGIYRTGVGQPAPTEEFELVGFASGDLLSFTVNFGKYGSLTAWAGQHTVENKVERIYTLWHLARNVKDAEEPKELWGAILAGANTFERA